MLFIMVNSHKKLYFIRRLRLFWKRNYAAIIVFLFLGAIAHYAVNIEPDNLRVTEYTFYHEKVTPELDGTILAFAADLHCNSRRLKLWKKVANIINSRNDISAFLLGGDFVNGNNRGLPLDDVLKNLKMLKNTKNIFSVPGNHEYRYRHGGIKAITAAFKQHDLKFMQDESCVIQNDRGGKFNLVGLDFMTNPHDRRNRNRTRKLFSNDMLNVVLTHTPEDFAFMPDNAHLTLAGHTHGCQINIPFLGSVINPPGYSRFRNYGTVSENNRLMYITCGLGSAYTQARLFMEPELVIIKLKMANKK